MHRFSTATRRAVLLPAVAALIWAISPARAAEPAVVTVRQGQLAGQSDGAVAAFLGIPFAAPPVDKLRWTAPQPPAPWHGVRSAATPGPICVQRQQGRVEAGIAGAPMSEDCLYLNVWRPLRAASKLPVMVWIHGGAFRGGSGALPLYKGSNLARRGVIVVTINYRLGALGTFSQPALRQEAGAQPAGNYGLLDQIAALRWVKDNIEAFGGDADRVTVFGESAGGASVLYLAASPLATGLFGRAIVQSGGLDLDENDQAHADAIGDAMAARVLGDRSGDPASRLARLRALPAAMLLAMPEAASDTMPFVDGQIVPQRMRASAESGKLSRLDLLIGRNSDEAGFFPETFWTRLPKLLAADWPAARALVDPVAARTDNAAARQLAGDIFAGVNTAAIARAHGGGVHAYYFDVVPESQRNSTPGAVHTADLPYVFENLPAGSGIAATRLSGQMASLWVQFAKTGHPAAAGVPDWPPFQADEQLLIIRNQGFSIGKDPAKARLDWLDQARPWHVN